MYKIPQYQDFFEADFSFMFDISYLYTFFKVVLLE